MPDQTSNHRWTKEQNLHSKNLILSTQVALDEALSALLPDSELIARLTATLNDAYSEEESYWRQRSRIQWLQDGDCNTGFFHAVTRGRNAVNKLAVIENDAGEAAYGDDSIAKCIADFYREVFTSSPRGDLSFISDVIQPLVSEEMNQLLIAIPTDLEIKGAVFSIHKDKAPGRMVSRQVFTRVSGRLLERMCAKISKVSLRRAGLTRVSMKHMSV